MKAGRKRKLNIAWILAVFMAAVWLVIAALPFFYMIMNSFKKQFEMLREGVFALPKSLNFSNYRNVLANGFFGYFLNSVLLTATALAVLLLISACAAYPLGRMHFRLRGLIFAFIIACMSIPIHATLIPIFKMTTNIGMYDKLVGLVGPYAAFGTPMSVFILTNFMKGIPDEIEEAAEIDGCSKYRTFYNIILPLSKPGLSTLVIYNGVSFWNEYAFAKTLTQSTKAATLPLALQIFKGEHAMDIPMILTVLVLSALPMIVLFIIFQDKLVKGMIAGAVKG